MTVEKVLYIARYRSASMHRKVMLLAEKHDFEVLYVHPESWRDEFGTIEQPGQAARARNLVVRPMKMFGQPNNPHRSTYRSIGFGLRQFAPGIIMAEEEPDSMAAVHIACARAAFSPKSKLALYTWQNQARPMGALARGAMKVALASSDAVVCANSEAAALLRSYKFARPTPVIPAIGVDTTLFKPAENASENQLFTIGYVGRLDPAKGLNDLVDACAMLSNIDFQLRVIGDGPYRAGLSEYAEKMGIVHRLRLISPLQPEALRAEYLQLSVLVLPSRTTTTWKEQFGRVLTEAMACGVPVIGSDSGAIPEVVGTAGLIFPEGDAQALATQLRQLSNDKALVAELHKRGVARVAENYTQDRIADQTAAFLQELLHQ